MPIIMISGAPHGQSEALAKRLQELTGWPLLGRQVLLEEARKAGIKVGRLINAVIRSVGSQEKLAREKDLYLAFITKRLCESVIDDNLIYYGRFGHLLCPGVSHRIRVGLTTPMHQRVKNVMQQLNLPQEKAITYLEQIDADVEKWSKFIHRETAGHDPRYYDICLNLQHINIDYAAEMIHQMSELPEFAATKQSRRQLEDLLLAARARLLLAANDQTRNAELGVRAKDGVLTVTYMPRQKVDENTIKNALADLEGCREQLCTMAETSILWIQERFDPESESFSQINQLAQRWGAAVELLRVVPSTEAEKKPAQAEPVQQSAEYTGGVEDDGPEIDDGGLTRTMDELIAEGRFAGARTIYGDKKDILDVCQEGGNYSLVVIGDMFLEKGHEARMRDTRELAIGIRDSIKVPVITANEMQSRFLFGKRHLVRLLAFAALVACIYLLVFHFQEPILSLLGGKLHEKMKWLSSLAVAIFVPVVAYCYSTVTGLLLKAVGID